MVAANHLASTSRVQLRYIKEEDFGVTPTTGNALNVRMTGESLDFALTKETDKEIRDDRQMTSSTTVNAAATGDVKVHMQYAEYDPWFSALLQNPWAAHGTNGVGTSFTADFTATTITASAAPTGTSAFTTLQRGQWFRLNAAGNVNNNKLFRVSSTVAPSATVITVDASTPLAVGTAVANVTLGGARLTNGIDMPTFTIERAMSDVTEFMAYRGMAVSKFSTSFASASLTEGTFTFMGRDMKRSEVTTLPGTPVASQGYDIQNAVTGVGNIWEGGAPLQNTYIKSMTLDIDNTLRAQDAIGNLGAVGIGVGTFSCKGSLEVYFSDGAMYDKFLNDVYTSIVVSSQDAQKNGYVFTFPRVQLTSAKVQAGAKDTDLMASFEYEAYADINNATPALRKTLIIDRVGAAVILP